MSKQASKQPQTANQLQAPKQARAKVTYEKILAAGQEILAESGLEALNSNAVVARAGVTPPMFYRYFRDKYDLLMVLGRRFSDVQNALYDPVRLGELHEHNLTEQLYGLLVDTLKVSEKFKGGHALMVSLRAVPLLSNLRLESNREMSKIGAHRLMELYPDMPQKLALHRSRLITEIGYGVIELLMEDRTIGRKKTLWDTACAQSAIANLPFGG